MVPESKSVAVGCARPGRVAVKAGAITHAERAPLIGEDGEVREITDADVEHAFRLGRVTIIAPSPPGRR